MAAERLVSCSALDTAYDMCPVHTTYNAIYNVVLGMLLHAPTVFVLTFLLLLQGKTELRALEKL